MFSSFFIKDNLATFPEFTEQREYMIPFYKKEGLPAHLSRWQPTVDAMLKGINTDKEIYFMCDQALVEPNNTHRREGIHVDGVWDPVMFSHYPTGHSRTGHKQLIILSSNVGNTEIYKGNYQETTENDWNGGDYSHLDTSNFTKQTTKPNQIVVGYSDKLLHSSGVFSYKTKRSLVRLNVNY